jgi:hypothetical protein
MLPSQRQSVRTATFNITTGSRQCRAEDQQFVRGLNLGWGDADRGATYIGDGLSLMKQVMLVAAYAKSFP